MLEKYGADRFSGMWVSSGLGLGSPNREKGSINTQRMAYARTPKGDSQVLLHSSFDRLTCESGIGTATARLLLSRLAAFHDETLRQNGESVTEVNEGTMISVEVFARVIRCTGVTLTDDEVLLLADATDDHPAASMVKRLVSSYMIIQLYLYEGVL
jgi:hypothetical protein